MKHLPYSAMCRCTHTNGGHSSEQICCESGCACKEFTHDAAVPINPEPKCQCGHFLDRHDEKDACYFADGCNCKEFKEAKPMAKELIPAVVFDHTPTPWKVHDGINGISAIYGKSDDNAIPPLAGALATADAKRAIECVNACEGIPSELLNAGEKFSLAVLVRYIAALHGQVTMRQLELASQETGVPIAEMHGDIRKVVEQVNAHKAMDRMEKL